MSKTVLSLKKLVLFATFSAISGLVSFIFFLAAEAGSGDTSTFYGFVSIVCFLFICLPLLFVSTIAISIAKSSNAILYLFVIVNLLGHGALAFQLGFFDKLIDNIDEKVSSQSAPQLSELRKEFSRGPRINHEVIAELLSKGADPNGSIHGTVKIPFIVVAASYGDLAAMELLLHAGADANARAEVEFDGIQQPSALDVLVFSAATHKEVSQAIKAMVAKGAHAQQTLLALGSCSRGDMALFVYVTELAEQRQRDDKNNNCLHLAAQQHKFDFIDELLQHNEFSANARRAINQANELGQFPLDIASLQPDVRTVEVIQHFGGTANKMQTSKRIAALKQRSSNR